MFEIKGKYACAKVFTDVLEPSAEGQIKAMCDQPRLYNRNNNDNRGLCSP